MDRPDLAADYADAATRRANREQLRGEIAEWTRDHSSDEILALLDGRVPAAPVQSAADVFADPHVHTREMLADVSQPGAEESMTIAGSPIKMTETNPRPRGRAPLLDEHREELLGDGGGTSGREAAESDD
jgi:succinyl-CoA:mesaconate CoA transferase